MAVVIRNPGLVVPNIAKTRDVRDLGDYEKYLLRRFFVRACDQGKLYTVQRLTPFIVALLQIDMNAASSTNLITRAIQGASLNGHLDVLDYLLDVIIWHLTNAEVKVALSYYAQKIAEIGMLPAIDLIIPLLIEYGHARQDAYQIIITTAINCGDTGLVGHMLHRGANQFMKTLIQAIQYDSMEVVQLVLDTHSGHLSTNDLVFGSLLARQLDQPQMEECLFQQISLR